MVKTTLRRKQSSGSLVGRLKSRSVGPMIHDPKDLAIVPHADDMDDETFLKHMDKRHRRDTKVDGKLVLFPNRVTSWVKLYRTYHERLHQIAIPGQYDHEHLEPTWLED